MWSPDVYEGSPIPVTTFFALVPKIAGMAVILRLTVLLFGHQNTILSITWMGVLQVVSALTMIVGNVAAIGQSSVKRMLAYSSIGHAGFMLLGVVVSEAIGISSVVFYLVAYLFMTLVAFYITSFVNDEFGNDHFERFNGFASKYPLMAILMTLVMFSLTGLPPLAGFVAKFNIFYAALSKKLYALALIGGITSVISLYFYTKIIRYMYFNALESEAPITGFKFLNQALIVALTLPVIFLGIFWSGLYSKILDTKLFFIH
jgi:NADH-quinone oxidoreductase subunit N